MQIHIDSLECLENLALQLRHKANRVDEYCQQAVRDSQAKLEAAQSSCSSVEREHEEAESHVAACQADVEAFESSSEEEGEETGDQDESADLEEAEQSLSEALQALSEATQNLEIAHGKLRDALTEHEQISSCVAATRMHLEHQLHEGIVFLHQKIEQLQTYVATTAPSDGNGVAQASQNAMKWLRWNPATDVKLQPSLLGQRFDLPKSTLEQLTNLWYKQDQSLRRQIDTLRQRYENASTLKERAAVRMASRRGAAGRLGELIAENALRPLARKIELQRRTTTSDHSTVTITDIVLRGLRMPVHLGNLKLEKGADAGAEIKCGRAPYLTQQVEHMCRQVAGHHREQASFCFFSRDFRDLSRSTKAKMARELGKHRAKIYAILPKKSTIDHLVWKQIVRR